MKDVRHRNGFEWKRFTFEININIKTVINFIVSNFVMDDLKQFVLSSLEGEYYTLGSLEHIHFPLPHLPIQ